MNDDFKPYAPDETYKCVLKKEEVLLIQKVRAIEYGQVTAHVVKGKILRTEMIKSEMSKESKEQITIAILEPLK